MLFTIIVINFFDGYFYNNVIILHTSCPFFFYTPSEMMQSPHFFPQKNAYHGKMEKRSMADQKKKKRKNPPWPPDTTD